MTQTAAPLSSRTTTPTLPLKHDPDHPTLIRAHAQASDASLPPSVSPHEAWELLSTGAATLLDVRTVEERKFIGFVPDSLHLPWQLGTSFQTNPRFVRELEAKIPKGAVLMLICRSGPRSRAAAAAALKAGYRHVYYVREGFEGELDEQKHRGHRDGWRFHGLPWQQE